MCGLSRLRICPALGASALKRADKSKASVTTYYRRRRVPPGALVPTTSLIASPVAILPRSAFEDQDSFRMKTTLPSTVT
jgi:hypothetical protein